LSTEPVLISKDRVAKRSLAFLSLISFKTLLVVKTSYFLANSLRSRHLMKALVSMINTGFFYGVRGEMVEGTVGAGTDVS
jgi:hypothetical protein